MSAPCLFIRSCLNKRNEVNVRLAKLLSLETAVFLWEGASVTGVLRTFRAQDEAFHVGLKLLRHRRTVTS